MIMNYYYELPVRFEKWCWHFIIEFFRKVYKLINNTLRLLGALENVDEFFIMFFIKEKILLAKLSIIMFNTISDILPKSHTQIK